MCIGLRARYDGISSPVGEQSVVADGEQSVGEQPVVADARYQLMGRRRPAYASNRPCMPNGLA